MDELITGDKRGKPSQVRPGVGGLPEGEGPGAPSLGDQIKCVERELALRGNVYAKRVKSGKMSPVVADLELEHMRAVLDTLDRQPRIWGPGDLMVVAAFRYCLGRRTYIVSDCVDWLIDMWQHIHHGCRDIIMRELDKAFDEDDRVRVDNLYSYSPLGMDCDREQWRRLKETWRQ